MNQIEIPKIIHQTWKTEDVPLSMRQLASTWQINHPTWKYKLWTDIDNLNFVTECFPNYLEMYNSFPHPIQRVDAVRYLILLKYGGLFVDLDFECLRNFEPLIVNNTFLFGKEPEDHCIMHNRKLIISNALMASTPDNDFLKHVINEMLDYREPIGLNKNDVILESTGPFLLTKAYQNYEYKNQLSLLGAELIYPLTKKEIHDIMVAEKSDFKPLTAYAIHYYAGTWWRTVSLLPLL